MNLWTDHPSGLASTHKDGHSVVCEYGAACWWAYPAGCRRERLQWVNGIEPLGPFTTMDEAKHQFPDPENFQTWPTAPIPFQEGA